MSLDDFKVGEHVVPLAQRELTFIVIDIDKNNGLVICGIPDVPGVKGKFKPEELEKKNVTPPNLVDFNTSGGD